MEPLQIEAHWNTLHRLGIKLRMWLYKVVHSVASLKRREFGTALTEREKFSTELPALFLGSRLPTARAGL